MLWLWNKVNRDLFYLTVVSKLYNSYLMHFSPAAHLPSCFQSAHLSTLSSVCRLHALVHVLMGFPFCVLSYCQLKTLIFVHAFSLRVLRRRWVEEWIVGAVNWREIVQLWSILWELQLVIFAEIRLRSEAVHSLLATMNTLNIGDCRLLVETQAFVNYVEVKCYCCIYLWPLEVHKT